MTFPHSLHTLVLVGWDKVLSHTHLMRLAKDNSSSRTKSEVVVRFVSGCTTTSNLRRFIFIRTQCLSCQASSIASAGFILLHIFQSYFSSSIVQGLSSTILLSSKRTLAGSHAATNAYLRKQQAKSINLPRFLINKTINRRNNHS